MSDSMNDEKQALVPRLRFPEFRDAGEWECTTLADIASIRSGTTPSRAEPKFYEGGTIPWVKTTDLNNSFVLQTEEKITQKAKARVNSVDSVLVAMYGGFNQIGRTGYLKFPAATNQAISVLNTNRETVLPIYLITWLNAKVELWKKIASSSRKDPNITGSDVASFPISFSGIDEQQKIADCLSSLDALIAAQSDKLDALKTHKKGLMQQLFPREGEIVPRLRFPEFRGAGEWEIKKAKFLFSNRVEQGEDGLPIYSVTMNDGLAKRDSLYRKIDDILEASGNKKARKHDIVYNMMRMWQGASGVAIEDCMVSPAYVVLAPNDNVCAGFYGYFLKLPQSLQVLTAHSQGLTKDRLRLYFKDFAQILLPSSFREEQQKIADCLSSIDTLIAAHAEKLNALKIHKKGLMQQLFPSSEA